MAEIFIVHSEFCFKFVFHPLFIFDFILAFFFSHRKHNNNNNAQKGYFTHHFGTISAVLQCVAMTTVKSHWF